MVHVRNMYHQIKVDSDNSNFQRILFRMNPDKPVQELELLAVIYGTKSMPFLATQCLKTLADSTSSTTLARPIGKDFYVDDLMTGEQQLKNVSNYIQIFQYL